jgi:hypothetical protein
VLALAVLVPPPASTIAQRHGRDRRPPPPPAITSGPARPTATTTARFEFSDAEARVRFRCRLDRARAARCAGTAKYRALAEGAHVFRVWALDAAGNRSARKTYAWTIDLARPPRPALSEQPDELTAIATAPFAFSDAEPGVALRCRLDDGPPQPCTSPARYEKLADGAHRFAVVARDAAGNISLPATHGWTLDTQAPPAPSIAAAPPAVTAATRARVGLADDEAGVRLRCSLDDEPASCDGVDGLAEGTHAFAATAVDGAGNESAPATHSWTIDATAPPAPTITARPENRAPRTDAMFVFTAAEASTTFVCRLDDAPALPCASPQRYPGPLAAGTHAFAVQARDAAGNRSPAATATWTVVTGLYLYRDAVLATTGLLGYWRLGEAAWARAADERGASPGAYSGGVTLGAAGAIPDDPDTAAAFDGSSGETLLPGPALSVNGTLEGWFDWRAGTAVLRDHSGAGGWILAFDAGGTMSGRAAGRTLSTGIDVATKVRGGWHHLVLTKAGPNLAFYFDGAFVAGTGGAGNAASVAPWHVMNNGTFAEQYAQGRADEVAIYDRALTATEIAAHYGLGRGDA